MRRSILKPFPDDEPRVVLFDLDGTLMDSEKARKAAWKRALNELIRARALSCTLDVARAAYEAIYRCHTEIAGEVGPRGHVFEDVRQHWNARSSYALLIAWINRLGTGRIALSKEVQHHEDRLKNELKHGTSQSPLFAEAEIVRDHWNLEYASALDAAVDAFWADDFTQYRYPGVVELLSELQDRENQGFEYYIATEGHLPTQWRKICALCLATTLGPQGRPLVTQDMLLTTSVAARSAQDTQALDALIAWYQGRQDLSSEVATLAPPDSPLRKELLTAIRSAEPKTEGLLWMKGLLQRLNRKVCVVQGQVLPEFYLRVIYAIHQTPVGTADALQRLSVRWEPGRRLRLAMVGDKYDSDIDPLITLGRRLDTQVMTVWVQQSSYKAKAPAGGSRASKTYARIAQAREVLLSDACWEALTKPIEKPGLLFASALETTGGGGVDHASVERLVAGIAATRESTGAAGRGAPDRDVLARAEAFVGELLPMVVADIRLSPARGQMAQALLDACNYPQLLPDRSDRRSIEALLDLLLQVIDGDAGPHASCYSALVRLLDVSTDSGADLSARSRDERIKWAAALVMALSDRPSTVQQMCADDDLAKECVRYLSNLLDTVALGFPDQKCRRLLGEVLRLASHGDGPPPPPPTPPQPSIVLGKRSPTGATQQSVLLGHEADGEEREVRCLLGAEDVHNVICLCGAPGQGKSMTLGTLIRGALEGECGPDAPPMPSRVIVFEWGIEGASKTVGWAHGAGLKPLVLGLRDELGELDDGYREVTKELREKYNVTVAVDVRPLCFALQWLPDEVILEVTKVRGASRVHLEDILKPLPTGSTGRTLAGLRNAVTGAPDLTTQIRNSLRMGLDRLEPFLATAGETPADQLLQPGQLVVVDCGRIRHATATDRLDRWSMVLRLLRERSESVGQDEHYLLVFDELNAVFGKSGEPAVRRLAENLRGLADEGRHVHVSIVAASQKPSHFCGKAHFADDANVLLFHKLGGMGAFPDGALWQAAHTNSALKWLEPRTVQYYAEADASQPLAGLVKIRPPAQSQGGS